MPGHQDKSVAELGLNPGLASPDSCLDVSGSWLHLTKGNPVLGSVYWGQVNVEDSLAVSGQLAPACVCGLWEDSFSIGMLLFDAHTREPDRNDESEGKIRGRSDQAQKKWPALQQDGGDKGKKHGFGGDWRIESSRAILSCSKMLGGCMCLG